jgi:hypothetical protein
MGRKGNAPNTMRMTLTTALPGVEAAPPPEERGHSGQRKLFIVVFTRIYYVHHSILH